MPDLFQLPKVIPLNAGVIMPGAKLRFDLTGTSTPQNTYADAALTTPNANPIIADANGVFAPIYLDPNLPDYRVTLMTSANVVVNGYPVDNVPALSTAGANQLSIRYAVDTGVVNAISLTLANPSITAYAAGLTIEMIPSITNTGATTVNVNSLGARDLRHVDGSVLLTGEVIAGHLALISYNASAACFELLSNGLSVGINYNGARVLNGSATGVDVSGDISYGGVAGNRTGSFAPIYGGFGTPPASGNIAWSISGKTIATLRFPAASTGISNATTFSISNLPVALTPVTGSTGILASLVDNSIVILNCIVQVTAGGVINFYPSGTSLNWTASGNKGFQSGAIFMFPLN